MKFKQIRRPFGIFLKQAISERTRPIGSRATDQPMVIFLAGILMLSSCGKPLPVFDHLDLAAWKDDRNACGSVRVSSMDQLEAQKEKLLALSEMDIVHVLGKPDRNQLSDRNQKFYYYFVQPAGTCSSSQSVVQPARLAIRFNAMGLAKEVRIEQHYDEGNSVNQ